MERQDAEEKREDSTTWSSAVQLANPDGHADKPKPQRGAASEYVARRYEALRDRLAPNWLRSLSRSEVIQTLILSATIAYSIFAGWQLIVVQGQLKANRAALRPFIAVTISHAPTFDPASEPETGLLTLRVSNLGGGGASRATINFIPAYLGKNGDTTIPTFMYTGTSNPFERAQQQIGPGATVEYPLIMVPPRPQEMQQWVDGRRGVRVYGRISYCDVFGTLTALPFCVEASEPLGKAMVFPCVTPQKAIELLDLQAKRRREERPGDYECPSGE